MVSFFLFKQKTSYEMRISDWSSDVCSSDLFGPGKGAGDWSGNWRTLLMLWGFPGLAMLGALGLDPTPRAVVWTFMLSAMGLACIINSRRCGRKIGSASCREKCVSTFRFRWSP